MLSDGHRINHGGARAAGVLFTIPDGMAVFAADRPMAPQATMADAPSLGSVSAKGRRGLMWRVDGLLGPDVSTARRPTARDVVQVFSRTADGCRSSG